MLYLTLNEPPPPYTTDTYTWTKQLLRECADALNEASGGAIPKEIVGDISELRFVATEEGIVLLERAGADRLKLSTSVSRVRGERFSLSWFSGAR